MTRVWGAPAQVCTARPAADYAPSASAISAVSTARTKLEPAVELKLVDVLTPNVVLPSASDNSAVSTARKTLSAVRRSSRLVHTARNKLPVETSNVNLPIAPAAAVKSPLSASKLVQPATQCATPTAVVKAPSSASKRAPPAARCVKPTVRRSRDAVSPTKKVTSNATDLTNAVHSSSRCNRTDFAKDRLMMIEEDMKRRIDDEHENVKATNR